MGIFSALKKGFKAVVEDINKPESFKKGEKLEAYVRNHLFPKDLYDLVEQTHSHQANSTDFVESSLKPDFKFRDKKTRKEFFVEVKFRSTANNGKVLWCSETQLKRYTGYQKECPVFILIGFGGEPADPDLISLLPITQAKYTGLYPSVLTKHEIVEVPIKSQVLWDR